MINKKIKNIIQIMLCMPLLIVLSGDNLFLSTDVFDNYNNNLNKTIEEQVIITSQKQLALETTENEDKKTNTQPKKTNEEKKTNTKTNSQTEKTNVNAEVKKTNKNIKTKTNTTEKKVSSFIGKLTAYVINCKDGCGGTLACKPSYNVKKKGIYYNDSEYGNVRIVASSSKYPCGSILRFKLNKKQITAIVLDRGVYQNKIDLLTQTEKDAYSIGVRKNLKFEILRKGW